MHTKAMEPLAEIEVKAALEFGGADLRLREVLCLRTGTTVMLDREVEAPVDLVVGERVVARGEVVIVSGQFALRVLECVAETEEQEALQ